MTDGLMLVVVVGICLSLYYLPTPGPGWCERIRDQLRSMWYLR